MEAIKRIQEGLKEIEALLKHQPGLQAVIEADLRAVDKRLAAARTKLATAEQAKFARSYLEVMQQYGKAEVLLAAKSLVSAVPSGWATADKKALALKFSKVADLKQLRASLDSARVAEREQAGRIAAILNVISKHAKLKEEMFAFFRKKGLAPPSSWSVTAKKAVAQELLARRVSAEELQVHIDRVLEERYIRIGARPLGEIREELTTKYRTVTEIKKVVPAAYLPKQSSGGKRGLVEAIIRKISETRSYSRSGF